MKKKSYLVLDCETATLPFANQIARNADEKKTIAIAKPLIYDIGWTVCDRAGNILTSKQFLIAETFSVPSIFNTAYYAEKRPRYIDMLERGETTIKPWREAIAIFLQDAATVDAIGAYNSMFDFKKAIPFTELYINQLYGKDYFEWERQQKEFCEYILTNPRGKSEKEFEPEVFRFRGETYPLFDLWGLSVSHLLNNASYKKECLQHELLTASGLYFKSSAESTYQYICNKFDFVESHTALDDAMIESFILSKIAARHAIDIGIQFFPFRDLGYTTDFCMRKKYADIAECETVVNALEKYLQNKEEESTYIHQIENKINALKAYMGV